MSDMWSYAQQAEDEMWDGVMASDPGPSRPSALTPDDLERLADAADLLDAIDEGEHTDRVDLRRIAALARAAATLARHGAA